MRSSPLTPFIRKFSRLEVTILLFLIALSFQGLAQTKNEYKGFPSLIWPKLYNIQYQKESADFGGLDKPIFSEAVKALSGKTVTLPGYMIPFEKGMKGNHFMLSSLPINACFFCGVGGPESVVEVFLKEEVFYNDKPIEVRGILKLNNSDPEKMIYILEDAEVVGEVGF
jgi:hypothetical protein